MNSLTPLVLLLLLAILFAASYQEVNTRLIIIVITLLIGLFVCYTQMKEQFSNYAPVLHNMGKCGGIKYNLQNNIYPLGMSYANLKLNPQPKPEYPLVSDVTIFSPVGDGIKLTQDPVAHRYPTVDGQEGSPKHMFILAHNQSRPECCPSTYSNSIGCVCTTEQQRKYINTRGGNRIGDENYQKI